MRFRTVLIAACVLSLLVFICPSFAQVKCIETDGEAAVVSGDVPSAKAEAVARAKWAAIEKVIGVEVKAQSLIQNMTLFDDAVKTEARGVIKDYRVLNQDNRNDIVSVRIKACVEPASARNTVSALALNNSIAVFIPAKRPRSSEYEETNILSETLIGRLKGQDYTVVDVAPTQAVDAAEIENAVKSGSTVKLRSLFYRFLSNLLIIGKVDYNISTKKGEDIGYGISMPFNNVTVRMDYRIVARNNQTGKTEILWSEAAQGKGLANTVEDAAAEGMKDLAEKITPVILEKVAKYIQGNVKKISVKVNGIPDLDTNMDVKGILQNIVWVTGVEEKSMGEFIVSYPENSIYLANSIKQKGNFKIVNFSSYSIVMDYQK
ncbi:MAG: hypothetical protein ACE14T_08415 [Syntrophales bacterium]